MKTILIAAIGSMILTVAHAETIKLACSYTETISYTSGNESKESGRIVLEVQTNGNYIFVNGTAANLDIAVANQKVGPLTEAQDLSDSGKWSMSNKYVGSDGKKVSEDILIDRNTGDFNFHRDREGGIASSVGGVCSKIDQSKRKF